MVQLIDKHVIFNRNIKFKKGRINALVFYIQFKVFWINILKAILNSLTALLAHRLAIFVSIPWYFNGLDDPREIKFLR